MMYMKKLYRSTKDSYIFGILGGLGEYFQVDSTLLRLAFVFFVLVTGFFPGGLAYFIAYFIVPENPKDIAHKTEHDSQTKVHADTDSKSDMELL